MRTFWATIGALILSFIIAGHVFGSTVLFPSEGGTGIRSATTSDVGKALIVSSINPFSYYFGTVGGSISINGVSTSTFTLSSSTYLGITNTGSNFTFTNLGVTTTAGNWQGTFQNKNASDFAPSSTVSSQWTTTSTGIFYNGGRVGIGTAAPDHALTVSGNGHFTQGIMVDNLVSTSSYFLGNVGIGTTTPATTLDVNGSSTFRGNIYTPALGSSGCIVLTTGGLHTTSTCITSNSGDWAGTWQTHSPSYFQTALGFTPLNPANNLSELTNTSTARTNLGLGDSATLASSTWFKVANNLSEGTATTMRTNLGLGTIATQNANSVAITGGSISVGNLTSTATTSLATTSVSDLTVGSLSGIIKGTSGHLGIATNGTDYTLTQANTCGAGYHINSLAANGSSTCSADSGGGGSTSTSITTFTIEYPTASENDTMMIFNSSTTIKSCYAVNKTAGDTVTWGIGYSSSRATATSSLSQVVSATTTTATTTPVYYAVSSSSPLTGYPLIFYTTAASSTQFTVSCQYTTP
ncbi:hypothetical protein M1506_02095 [Patescibacteria group bacterium]|nr:hypothetical protein [Patescibacteria group bacterium]